MELHDVRVAPRKVEECGMTSVQAGQPLVGAAGGAATRHRASLGDRPVMSGHLLDDVRAAFDLPLPEAGLPPDVVLAELVTQQPRGIRPHTSSTDST